MQKYSEISTFTFRLRHFAHVHPTLRITSWNSLSKCARFSLLDMGTVKTKQIQTLIQSGMKDLVPLGKCVSLEADMHPCDSFYDGCFKKSGLCVYDKLPNDEPAYCPDDGHLQNCENFVCPGKFKCEESYCIPFQRLCDGMDDCPKGDDEINCHESFCNNSF